MHKNMPVVIGTVGNGIYVDDIRRLRVILSVEEKQLDALRFAREDAEVHALAGDCGAKRIALSTRH
jgi:hypothetical protein